MKPGKCIRYFHEINGKKIATIISGMIFVISVFVLFFGAYIYYIASYMMPSGGAINAGFIITMVISFIFTAVSLLA